MKRYSMFALCASVIVASCTVSNLNEDNSAALMNGGDEVCTTINATIDDTKTAFGTPDGSTYPVLWQTGDKIIVNGVESNALAVADYEGQGAEFTFASAVASPYKAVYPSSAVKEFGATTKINVPYAQAYVANNFDPAAGIMLGTGTDKISFASAVAFLKIRTTGSEQISRVEVMSLGNEPMAGAFVTTDFATMTPDANGFGFPAVSVTPSAPVAAGTTFIIAVPAQTYASGIKVMIQSPDGKVMQKKSEKSFAAAPGHMYAFTIDYAPVAVEGTITVDGNFDDWKGVPAVSYSLPVGGATAASIIKMSYTADNAYVYGYVEMDETVSNPVPVPMDIFVDIDGDVTTGGDLGGIYTASGVEWYIEGCPFDAGVYFDNFDKHSYHGVDGDGIFSALTNEKSLINSSEFAFTGATTNKGVGRFEFKMSRSRFNILGTKCAMGIKTLTGWAGMTGLLPIGESDARITLGQIAMKASTLPAPVNITIDGTFADWNNEQIATLNRTESQSLRVLKTVKYYADARYLYVYMEIENAKQFGEKDDFNVMMDFYIDCDGISNNGYKLANKFDHTCNFYYETFLADASGFGRWDNGQYYTTTGWGNWEDHALYPASVQGAYDSANDFAQVEARLGRSDFKLTSTKVGLGMIIMDGSEGWTPMGKLPENDAKSLFVMDIPAFVE